MTNEQKAEFIANQCKPCTEDFYSGIKQGVLLALNTTDKEILELQSQLAEKDEKTASELILQNSFDKICEVNKQLQSELSELKLVYSDLNNLYVEESNKLIELKVTCDEKDIAYSKISNSYVDLLFTHEEFKIKHKGDVITAIVDNLYEDGDDDIEQELHFRKASKYYKQTHENK